MTNFVSYEFNVAPLDVKLELMNVTIVDFVRWCIENKRIRLVGFNEALINMRHEMFSQCDATFFKDNYFSIKGDADYTAVRHLLLQSLVLQCLQYDMKDFFLMAFKKERNLDTRLIAIRGYSTYATEAEVVPLMEKFNKLLIKRNESAGFSIFDYQIYEPLRSKFGLPYLVERYKYDCFKEAKQLVDILYEKLPDALKGFYTFDENGQYISLISPEEKSARLNSVIQGDGSLA